MAESLIKTGGAAHTGFKTWLDVDANNLAVRGYWPTHGGSCRLVEEIAAECFRLV